LTKPTYNLTVSELASKMIYGMLKTVCIIAAAGVDANLCLAKVGMDIEAKHIPADAKDLWGYRIRRNKLSQLAAVTPISDRLLAHRQKVCEKAGGISL
jgi:hypothetical protein